MSIRLPFVLLLFVCAPALVARPAHAVFRVQAGIAFLAVLDATEGTELALEDRRGTDVGRGTADRFGSLIFRELEPGQPYVVRDVSGDGGSQDVTVLRLEDHPPASFYANQTLETGLQYIEMRDGTKLAAMVRLPIGATSLDQGPFPTVIEYSGYEVADPDSPEPSTLLASLMGYATVAINMRGSGCSGGVLDLFDLPTTGDGYDIIEAVAAQPCAGRPARAWRASPSIRPSSVWCSADGDWTTFFRRVTRPSPVSCMNSR